MVCMSMYVSAISMYVDVENVISFLMCEIVWQLPMYQSYELCSVQIVNIRNYVY